MHIRAPTRRSLLEGIEYPTPAPAGLTVGYEHEGEDQWSLLLLRSDEGLVLGSDTRVKISYDLERDPEPVVYLLMNPADGTAFEALTREYDGRRIAVLDGDEILMAPTVQEPIPGGQIMVTPGAGETAQTLYRRLTGQEPPPPPEPDAD